MEKYLQDKVALITGASRGIGAATARIFSSLGARVLLAARSSAEIDALAAELDPSGKNAIAETVDVSRYEDLALAVERCTMELGGLDVLINNAGVIEPISRMVTSDPDQWALAADINYKGVYFGMRAALPHFVEKGAGTIITVSSGAAHGPMEGWSHYCGAKAGAHMLTRCAHKENAEHGVRVFGLSPGTVATEMQVKIKASGINPVSQLDPSVHIDPSWPAQAIAWLCTAEADEFCGEEVSLKDAAMRIRMGLEQAD
ncbi:MAG: SDR family oxidoreductase [Gammaproteobacteria bacterium]